AQDHVRIVCFMTDGYVGNDMEIISEVQKHPNARIFSFGIGSSVNHFLLDKMAEYGRGEVEYVGLNDDGSAAARRFHERVRNPLLTDISVDWGDLKVTDVYPQRIPDLFSAKPVILTGRYAAGGHSVIRLKGKMSGRDFVREIPVDLPDNEPQHDVLATLWARTRIDNLMGQDMSGMQQGNARADVQQTITQLGLEYRLMTQFTSFVAVEEMTVTDGGVPRRVDVPVEIPAGVSRSGIFGEDAEPSGTPASQVGAGVGGAISMRRRPTGRILNQPAAPPVSTANGQRTANVMAEADERVDGATNRRATREEQRRLQLQTRMHPSISALIERLKRRASQPGADEAGFVHGGKADVQVWLVTKSPAIIAQLKRLGFEVVLDPQSSNMVIGRIAIEKLDALVRLNAVRYVAPQTQSSN
ncbi:MAG TPA: hypothetical protein VK619_04440, partial [Pyrinomonadaceae bacterium]|nr:hypothetical protein [Pyrinomonadaceae bacterium]